MTWRIRILVAVDADSTQTIRSCDIATGPGTGAWNGVTLVGTDPSRAGGSLPPDQDAACIPLPNADISVAKGSPTIGAPDSGGVATATYVVTVTNGGAGEGSYSLADTPAFPAWVHVTAVTVTRTDTVPAGTPFVPVAQGAGYRIADGVVIEPLAEHTYSVAISFTTDASGSDGSTCEPGTPSHGLFNAASLTWNDGTDSGQGCGDLLRVNKDVSTQGAHTLGDTVHYSIAADIPTTTPITAYVLRDVSGDAQGEVGVQFGTLTVSLSNGTALTAKGADPDYVLDIPVYVNGVLQNPQNAVCGGTGADTKFYGYFNVKFTATGMAKLQAAAANHAQVLVSYAATILTGDSELAGEPDTFVNEAQLYPSAVSIADCAPAVDDASYMIGVISVDKFAGDVYDRLRSAGGTVNMSGALLPGATFRIFGSLADAQAQTNPVAIMMSTATGGVPLDPASDGHSLVEGKVTCDYTEIPTKSTGVYVTGELVYGDYWVVETAAPPGYLADPTPTKFAVSLATSWGINGPKSPACAGPDGISGTSDDGTAATVIPVVPVLNTATNSWVTTNDWAIARVTDRRNPAANPVVNQLSATGAQYVWQSAVIGADFTVVGLFFLVLRRRLQV
jgi:hypothetical protein